MCQMITTKLPKPKDCYDPPKTDVFKMNLSSILCSSPGDGQNEDVGFEDWDLDD